MKLTTLAISLAVAVSSVLVVVAMARLPIERIGAAPPKPPPPTPPPAEPIAMVPEAKPESSEPAVPPGWKATDYKGVYWRWCDSGSGDCTSDKVIGDNDFVLAQVWCKERACGDIYAQVNLISDSGVVVGWTNDTGYGGQGQKVQLTFQSHQSDWKKGSLTKLNIRG